MSQTLVPDSMLSTLANDLRPDLNSYNANLRETGLSEYNLLGGEGYSSVARYFDDTFRELDQSLEVEFMSSHYQEWVSGEGDIAYAVRRGLMRKLSGYFQENTQTIIAGVVSGNQAMSEALERTLRDTVLSECRAEIQQELESYRVERIAASAIWSGLQNIYNAKQDGVIDQAKVRSLLAFWKKYAQINFEGGTEEVFINSILDDVITPAETENDPRYKVYSFDPDYKKPEDTKTIGGELNAYKNKDAASNADLKTKLQAVQKTYFALRAELISRLSNSSELLETFMAEFEANGMKAVPYTASYDLVGRNKDTTG